MQTVMNNRFSQTPSLNIQRSTFDRSHGVKTTFDGGYLVPVLVDEVLPGDTFNVRMDAFARLATPLKPIMDNLYLDSFFFAVPMRLLWSNWEKFNGAQVDPGDSTSYTVPQVTGTHTEGSLGDLMGLPIGDSMTVNSVFFRAYNLIYNEWFRDENLQDSVVVDVDDGPDTLTDYVLLKRGKRHDYFTSCLPWPQKNATEVSLPLGTSAPVDYVSGLATSGKVRVASTDALHTTAEAMVISSGAAIRGNGGTNLYYDPDGTLEADLTSATAATINELREAEQLQVMYERDARGGTRYTEIVRSHFGVVSPDMRMQRPEYLGGGSSPVNVHPVAQTGEAGSTAQGNLAGFGTASLSGHGFSKAFTEHCVIIGLVNLRADLTYQQGINRMWNRSTRFDFYWPGLAHLGEQEVLNKEIFYDSGGTPEAVFGYQERYAEYRYKPSTICGAFRSAAATPLDSWHLSQEFATQPSLDSDFIVEEPPIDRCIAVPSEPHMIFDGYIRMKCARPMPVYGIPQLGGRL